MGEILNSPQLNGPLARYQDQIHQGQLTPDAYQLELVKLLEQRYQRLIRKSGRWWRRRSTSKATVKGIYLHGLVGRGKTMLMDLFAQSLEISGIKIWRIHFHRFMDSIHEQLIELDGQRNPLTQVAKKIAKQARVLCLDEFHVSDIGDAMILSELLHQLAELNVVLITTSNTHPDNLYADGLQRARFLPAIDLIKQRCEVVSLDAREDYRLRALTQSPVYYWPESEQTRSSLEHEFKALSAGEHSDTTSITVRGRTIETINRAGSLAWFSFDALCEGPRAAADYIDLATRFNTLIISGVPVMDDTLNNPARRFIHFVDECYDRSVKLIIAAAAPAEQLYTGDRLIAEFERTSSRLIEMQSRDYLAKPRRS